MLRQAARLAEHLLEGLRQLPFLGTDGDGEELHVLDQARRSDAGADEAGVRIPARSERRWPAIVETMPLIRARRSSASRRYGPWLGLRTSSWIDSLPSSGSVTIETRVPGCSGIGASTRGRGRGGLVELRSDRG